MIDIAQLISTVGFPIVAFLLMYHMANKTIKENTKAIREMIARMKK